MLRRLQSEIVMPYMSPTGISNDLLPFALFAVQHWLDSKCFWTNESFFAAAESHSDNDEWILRLQGAELFCIDRSLSNYARGKVFWAEDWADCAQWLRFSIIISHNKSLNSPQAVRQFLSSAGTAGADKRNEPYRKLQTWTISEYEKLKLNGKAPSANRVAYLLKDKVVAHGREIGASLSEQNAQRTIAEWIRKAN